MLHNARAAVESFKLKKGAIAADLESALGTFFTLIAGEKNETAHVRGKQAKRARDAGEELPVAK
eukprot:1606889-Prymnesium_polylepis.1